MGDNMEFTNSYFKDEVREGFYIPGMIKRSWAMQLETLETIKIICEKYNIKWFADCGTLIGAIRHGGFIPWDDDLDICMLREDYTKFNEVILKELPEGYRVLNMDIEETYDNIITRIVANDTINNENEYLMKHHGFPYPSGVDIFPIDYRYPDKEREEERRKRALDIIEKASDKSICARMMRELDKISREYDGKDSKEVALMPFYFKYGDHIYPIHCFDKIIHMPFENTYINVPAAYDEILNIEYGNWYVANRVGGLHDYPYYADQQKILLDKTGTAPYWYKYNDDPAIVKKLIDARVQHKMSVDEKLKLLNALGLYHDKICFILEKGNKTDALALLEDCQQIAISVGTAIEAEYGEGTAVVKLLEQYCEIVYVLHEAILSGKNIYPKREKERISKLFTKILNNYKQESSKKTQKSQVVFMPVLADDWKYMKPLYDEMCCKDEYEIYVMPIPYAERADDGSVEDMRCDYESFSKELPLINYIEYAFDKIHPDMMVIQNPFDEYQSGLTVHPFFYTMNIYAYTDKLIYCQGFRVDDIDVDDAKAYTNIMGCVLSPGVLYSDEIYVPNDNMKMIYLDVLGQLPDCNTEEWDRRIHVLECLDGDKKEHSEAVKKTLLFYVGVCDYYSEGDKAMQWLEKCKDLLVSYNEKIDIVWAEEECMEDNVREVCPDIYQEYIDMKQKYLSNNIKIVSVKEAAANIKEYDGYYGSGGYLMNLCVREGIPVMVRNISNYVV